MTITDDENNTVSIYELSSLIGVGVTTLKTWEGYFNIYVERDHRKARRYNSETIKQFNRIKELSSSGRQLNEIKTQLQKESDGVDDIPKIEIINEKISDQEQNFNLVLKPYESRINELKTLNNDLLKENKELFAEVARLSERVQNKEAIINLLYQQKTELDQRLNKKWWKFWQ